LAITALGLVLLLDQLFHAGIYGLPVQALSIAASVLRGLRERQASTSRSLMDLLLVERWSQSWARHHGLTTVTGCCIRVRRHWLPMELLWRQLVGWLLLSHHRMLLKHGWGTASIALR